jgi:FixJ family two-component response regulator
MPDLNGVEAAKRIRRASPDTEILILSMHYSAQLIQDILESGIRGYIVKSDSDRDLTIAVETLADHKPFFTAGATEVMLSKFNKDKTTADDLDESTREQLTSREREIIQLIAEGKSSREIGISLFISAKTAETPPAHRQRIIFRCRIYPMERHGKSNDGRPWFFASHYDKLCSDGNDLQREHIDWRGLYRIVCLAHNQRNGFERCKLRGFFVLDKSDFRKRLRRLACGRDDLCNQLHHRPQHHRT